MHLANPIAQAIDNHPPNNGMIGVESVATAGVVGVLRKVLFQYVIGGVVKTAETQSRPVVTAFGSVVENDVENHFYARAMQCFHHIAEFVDGAKWILLRAVGLMWREKRNRSVSPVVDESDWAVLRIELENGE